MRALVLIAWLAPAAALAQAPGPLSRGHADLSGPLDCQRCHEGGTGVPDAKCLGCHDHRDLRLRIEAGKGFHADPEVKAKPCKDCHAEHLESRPGSKQGRQSTIDWRPFGGQRNFAHKRAGWPLEGAHRFQKCEKCHEKKSAKTGLTVFLGLRSECTACHKNPHEFRDIKLTDCTICHGFNNRKVPNLAATRFDHDKTAFPLRGLHTRLGCEKCHVKTKSFTVTDRDFGDCKGCHEDSHKSVISASRKCADCHKQETKFALTRFDHAKETRFPLIGQHAKNRCRDCHKLKTTEKPNRECAGCHADFHKGRFAPEPCEGCHVATGWKGEMVFQHAKTGFALGGAHTAAKAPDCMRCHRKVEPKGFERLASSKCADCHRHQDAHCGQFGLESCDRCHVRGGDRTSRFDHDVTGFMLVDAHARPGCDECHKPANLGQSPACRLAVKYTGLERECRACHEDIHKGELGLECSKCHTGGRDFKTLVFDHNRDSRFALTGFHQLVDCAKCHPDRRFKLGEARCESCHAKDDAHAGILGTDCAKCHETSGGAPKFDHDLHTGFVRDGVHARIECARCHFLPAPGTADRAALAKQGYAAVSPPGAQLDLSFRSGGTRCVDCHPDPHGVRTARGEPLDCADCHGAESWKDPPKNGPHSKSGFTLSGAHTVVDCGLCHTGAGRLTGRAESCGGCHVQDDLHAGSFGNACGDCHEQSSWHLTRFSHMSTGFVLEGIHRTLDCRGCHQAGNYFIGKRCYHCHLADYRLAPWHQGFEIGAQKDKPTAFIGDWRPGRPPATVDCGECHNQFVWTSAYSNPAKERRR